MGAIKLYTGIEVEYFRDSGIAILKKINDCCPLYQFGTVWVETLLNYDPVSIDYFSCFLVSAVMVQILS